MTSTGRPVAVLIVVALWLARAAPIGHAQPQSQPLAIVVHQSNPVDNLTYSELRRIFMLDTQTWPHGRKITVVLREKGQPERAETIRAICALSESDYDKHVLFRTFQGSVNIGPRSLASASSVLRFVFSAPGAIGSIAADQVDATVKVLRIDGYTPGDARYPLRRGSRGGGDDLP
jgi:ABC-type phosphate transport system substrate-binding protein